MALNESEIVSRLRDAIVALKEVRTQRDALQYEKSEPIAIIGIACRFPGNANTPEAFYDLLLAGTDAISAVPPERWTIGSQIDADPKLQGMRWGAFVENQDLFDPAFFGISPREAERMDPQQRLLLEVTWEALERSCLIPGSLVGSRTGVYVGIMNTDYFYMNLSLPRAEQDAYSATGNGHCFPAGRIAYNFGFQGPAMTIDTACSSSLVATHLAIQSLRSRESDLAIAAGCNLILDPLTSELIAKTGALSPDGRCKSFDSRANGYVRGEGCAVVLLKRYSDAKRDGDPIVALIRASAINQDGRSTGLTTPNVLSQQAMLEEALANAQLAPQDIEYIEAHGTGTPLGDPIEMEALRAVYGKLRTDGSRCHVGSVKTNIGHLEAAAGLAGLIKVALTLQGGNIPRSNHLRTLNPRISLDGTPITIATENISWSRGAKVRRSGVSSFGMSGTNAHVILEESPAISEEFAEDKHSAYLFPISAKNPEALSALTKSSHQWLSQLNDESSPNAIYTASVCRTHHEHRLVAVGANTGEISALLAQVTAPDVPKGVFRSRARSKKAPRIVFVFSGQGSQWVGMGRDLLTENAIFRSKLKEIDSIFQKHSSFSILATLDANESNSRLEQTEYAQPALFALQVALVEVLKSWGLDPDAVIGHSVGEIAAAYVAGALSLEDAVHLVAVRGRIMQKATGNGKMVWVALPAEECAPLIAPFATKVAIAAINDPKSVVLSGETKALEAITDELQQRNVTLRPLRVDYAFHSPQMDSLADELFAKMTTIQSRPPSLVMYSSVLGERIEGSTLVASYWKRNLRETVDLVAAVNRAFADGYEIFVEVGPHPVLVANLEQCATSRGVEISAIPTLKRLHAGLRALLEAVGALYVTGVNVDWKKLAPKGKRLPSMPTYPWQRRRYWLAPSDLPVTQTSAPRSYDDLLFTLEWQRESVASAAIDGGNRQGSWVIFMDRGRFGPNVIMRFRARGITCTRVDFGPTYAKHTPNHFSINASNPDDYVRVLQEAMHGHSDLAGVVHLASVDAPQWDETTVDSLQHSRRHEMLSALYLAQALLRHQSTLPSKLWLVSRGAISTGPEDTIQSVAQAPLWGLGRTIMSEHPELRCTCVDLDGAANFGAVMNFVGLLEMGSDEEHIALRQNHRFVGRFARLRLDGLSDDVTLKPTATYLITGGLGGLGLSIAQSMVDRGARFIALMARSAPNRVAMDSIAKMQQSAAKVRVIRGDVSHADNVLEALCTITAEMPELKGIIHAAGILDDRTLTSLSEESFSSVFAPKVDGAWNLHMLTSNQSLDFFVLYSSAAALFGSPGQANYAAANSFLDALARARQSRGLPAMSIQWGPFSEVGMAAAQKIRGDRMAAGGIESLRPEEGHNVLSQLLVKPRAEIAVIRMDVRQWLRGHPELQSRKIWSNLTADVSTTQAAVTLSQQPIIERQPAVIDMIANAPSTEHRKLLEEHIVTQIAAILRMDASKVDREENLQQYGLDSLMVIELRNKLQASMDMQVSVADVWSHASIRQLAGWFESHLGKRKPATPIPQPVEKTPPAMATKSPEIVAAKPSPIVRQKPSATLGAAGQWVIVPHSVPNRRMRLICFPYAGGGASIYSSWLELLPPDVELCVIQPPGRQSRIAEPFAKSVDEMSRAITLALQPYLDAPFAMFGHCLGAIVMFEVVRRLAKDHWSYPIHLFASGAPPPRQYLLPNTESRSNEEFMTLLGAIGLTKQGVLEDPDILRTVLPMIRADFAIAAQYEYKAGETGNVPITTFAGNVDAFAPPEIAEGWRHETSSHFSKHVYSGGHYFLDAERESIVQIVSLEMQYRLAAQKARSPLDAVRSITRPNISKEPRLRLVCFPGLANSAQDFEAMGAILPSNIELCVVDLAGHGKRSNEAPMGRVDDIVADIFPSIREHLDRPMVFWGNDLGALIMYECTLRLERAGLRLPEHCIALGAMAPQVQYFAAIHLLPAASFKGAVELMGLTVPAEALAAQALRADCAALANYKWTESPKIPTLITAFSADFDLLTPPTSIQSWKDCTSAGFSLHRMQCAHVELTLNKNAMNTLIAILERHQPR